MSAEQPFALPLGAFVAAFEAEHPDWRERAEAREAVAQREGITALAEHLSKAGMSSDVIHEVVPVLADLFRVRVADAYGTLQAGLVVHGIGPEPGACRHTRLVLDTAWEPQTRGADSHPEEG